MPERKYQVLLTGEIAEGKSVDDVKSRMAGLFKTTPDKMAGLLRGKNTVIKKNLDLATAEKYVRAIKATGAGCRYEDIAPAQPQPEAAAQPQAPEPAAAAEPRVIEVQLMHAAEPAFAPQAVEKVSQGDGGLKFAGAEPSEVPYDQIAVLSTYTLSSPEESKLLLFSSQSEKPYIFGINDIDYGSFPIKELPKAIGSFRNFLYFLCRQNPSINLEETTFDVLSGSTPQKVDEAKADKLATNIGKLLQSGNIAAQA